MAAVVAANAGFCLYHLGRGDWRLADRSALAALSTLALLNLAGAVAARNQAVLDALYRLAGKGSPSWPLWLRWSLSKVHHVGGLHAGCALAGTGWTAAFAATAIATRLRSAGAVTTTTLVVSWAIAGLLVLIVVCAAPPVRYRVHNAFELTHRWAGWTAVGLFWVLTVHLALAGRGGASALAAIVTDWHVGVLAAVTLSIAWPWLRLRRVRITVERPSDHAAIVQFDRGRCPRHPAAVAISRRPLGEWHAFATVSAPGRSGYRLLISRAGDWTGRFIDDPPSHVWLRGVPVTAALGQVTNLYRRMLYVVTGSGIGPCLGQLLSTTVPTHVVWSTRSPRATYGDALVDEVLAAQPGATIWDTTTQGKPDLVQLALDAYVSVGAEAVLVVSNKPTTLRLVRALEERGIPAFGPIWDS